jgi:hypothetical protein
VIPPEMPYATLQSLIFELGAIQCWELMAETDVDTKEAQRRRRAEILATLRAALAPDAVALATKFPPSSSINSAKQKRNCRFP